MELRGRVMWKDGGARYLAWTTSSGASLRAFGQVYALGQAPIFGSVMVRLSSDGTVYGDNNWVC